MLSEEEIWKTLHNYGEKYEVSNFGNVRRIDTKKLLKQYTHRKYKYVGLYHNKRMYNCRVHRLVAQEYCENYSSDCVVMHLDNNPANNNAKNLKCGTQKENIIQCRDEKRMYIPGIPKKINQYDLNGSFIKQWESQSIIEKTLNYKQRAISRCCLGKRKKAYKYIWKFAKEE